MNTTTTAKHRILSLALCLLVGMTLVLPGPVTVKAAPETIDVSTLTASSSGSDWSCRTVTGYGTYVELSLNGPGPFVLTGKATGLSVVAGAPEVAITLQNAEIVNNNLGDPLDCGDKRVSLTLEGANKLEVYSGSTRPALLVQSGASLTISGSGSLTANGGTTFAGIQVDPGGSVTITGNARVTAQGGRQGAGIGGRNSSGSGAVTISGNADVTAVGGLQGAGIGAGESGNGGDVTITGGRVTAIGGTDGADIGGGAYSLDGGTLHVSGGAELNFSGNGTDVDRADGSLEIGQCTITDADGGGYGDLTGSYNWLLVEDGTIDTVATAVEDSWLTDAIGRQIIRAGDPVTVDAYNPADFEQWYHSANITLADSADPTVTFPMPGAAA